MESFRDWAETNARDYFMKLVNAMFEHGYEMPTQEYYDAIYKIDDANLETLLDWIEILENELREFMD